MTPDAQPGDLVVPIRPERAMRGSYLLAGILTGLLLIIATAFALQKGAVGAVTALPCAVVASTSLWVGVWITKRQLPGSAFRVDSTGMHIETKKSVRTVAWADLDAVAVATRPQRGPAVLATLRPGVPKPATGSFGMPIWSTDLRCLIVVTLDLLQTTPETVSAAIASHAGERFRPDGRL
jgi:hypothetical protein